MRAFGYIATGLVGFLLALAITSFDRIVGPSESGQKIESLKFDQVVKFSNLDLSYTDFVTVMFTGATLVLAGVALVVGLVAVFSYQGIKREVLQKLHAKVDEQVATIDARIEKEVREEAEEKIAGIITQAGRDGALDQALERALIAINTGSGMVDQELEQDDDVER